ncbi:hypothetical protein FACS189430_10460 [Bacteroidia bacterium]|nr:hypothetical protein FACS189430_10460 [Bacteroidia bacterium]
MFFFPSCSDYLDVVPDKSTTLETMFSTRQDAYNALARVYSYLPHDEDRCSTWLLGDEWVNAAADDDNITGATAKNYKGLHIMRGLQSADNPILGTWSGTNMGKDLYEGINICNIFISNVDRIHDMKPDEIADWKAQAKFLKAYYHFLLLQQYGPIVIKDEETSPEAEPKNLYVARSKLDDCFNYIVKTLDEAIPALIVKREGIDLGQIDRLGATAIKAKVLLWRASPFYSGNTDYYDFYDPHDGKPFFPQDNATDTKAKWKDALDAIETAITLCENSGKDMYTFKNQMQANDFADSKRNTNLKTLYDLRYVIVDPWNEELIWGNSRVNTTTAEIFLVGDANIFLPPGYTGEQNQFIMARNILGATGKTVERFYTKHGLPLDEDNTFGRDTMYNITLTPDTSKTIEYLGVLQSNIPTINLYLNREPRFYADMGITGGYWRGHSHRIPTSFYSGGIPGSGANRFWTGIAAQKVIHPDSKSGGSARLIFYPIPIIRLADLYLMKAEARNEYLDAPDGEVYAAINKVRDRAGIPKVETAYTGSFVKSEYFNRHTTQAGMREIILNERGSEFAFEGQRFWDMLRYRRAPQEFSSPVIGWNNDGANAESFFQQKMLQFRMFTLKDCLWPIPSTELLKNSKLIQNPGW